MTAIRSIAIDGPAGSGKSTIGRMLADRLGYSFLDTGVLYRVVTLAAIRRGLEPTDEPSLARLAQDANITVAQQATVEGLRTCIGLDGEDVTDNIRLPEVDRTVSVVSSHPSVRAALLKRQRKIAGAGPSVLVGRDIGTVVLPDADLKLWVDADPSVRAARRFNDLRRLNPTLTYDQAFADLIRRDHLDREKKVSPLRRAPEALLVDTTSDPPEIIIERLERTIRRKCGSEA